MNKKISALCFDVGGTLRYSRKDPALRLNALNQMKKILAWKKSINDLEVTLEKREAKYRTWSRKTLIELNETDLWHRYMLQEYPEDWVAQNALIFNQLWRGRRIRPFFPEVVDVLKSLYERGYSLAIISNTTSSVEVPELIDKFKLKEMFSCVILSTTFGKRKPDPSLFLSAAKKLNINPEYCAYIGNDPTRDLIGTRQAGFGPVYLRKKVKEQDDDIDDENDYSKSLEMQPEGYFETLDELLNVFPVCRHKKRPVYKRKEIYNAALSTMWGIDQKIPFQQTFEVGKEIGFTRFELNHKVSPSLYASYDHNKFYIATVHEPCPTEFPYDFLKNEDIAISSLDESRRVKSLDMVKRSIELAVRLGSISVVIHPGAIVCDKSKDNQLRKLFQTGKRFSTEYEQLLEEIVDDRKRYVQPHLDNVLKSLVELIAFTKGSGVALALENRYRYYDIPLPDEMALLLDLCDEDWYGFQYDVGHAHTLDVLGMADHFVWLERFSERMIGVHLHDVCGITDHQVPGIGEVDFLKIAPFIPAHAQRTLEIGPQATVEELIQALRILTTSGCIQETRQD